MKKLSTFYILLMLLFTTTNALADITQYCGTEVTHLNIEAETNSAVFLTISKIDEVSFYVEIESATENDPVDFLLVNGTGGSVSEEDDSVEGKIRRVVTFAEGSVPEDIEIQVLWSKESIGGNWMIDTFTIPFPESCIPAEEDTQAPADFTASITQVSYNKIVFLLSATDNSGKVEFNISYNDELITLNALSGAETTYDLTGLSEATSYSFDVSVKDEAGNTTESISFSETTTIKPILSGAPEAPARDASNVISVYSDTYQSIVSNLNPDWGQSTVVSEEDFSDNKVLKYENLNYQGMEYPETNVSGMEYLHFDYWTADATSFNLYLIADGENSFDVASEQGITIGQWVGVDIPLLYFENAGRDLTKAYQFKITGDGTIYLDNFYFYKSPETEKPTGFTASLGEISYSSVELLLQASDNSGTVKYDITYNDNTVTATGASGEELSYILSGLDELTNYSFSIQARDVNNNVDDNSPIVLEATTIAIPVSEFCGTLVRHLNIEAETSSEIFLTISNIDETSMYVEIESATDGDPVDLLLLNVTGAIVSDEDYSVEGKIRRTVVFTDEVPVDVSINLLWSKESLEGNWMLNSFNVPFLAKCDDSSTLITENNQIELFAFPNPVESSLNIDFGDASFNTLNIYDISGQLLFSKPVATETNRVNLDMSGYNSGVYLVQLEGKFNIKTIRVIKK